jgi:acyl-CoA reductase-like NAD-dependent aldehyde dehydrogenase
MNAYELADELQKMFVGEEYDRLIHEIPDVLRQQADRVADLETALAFKKRKPLSDEEIDSIIYSVDWAYDPVLLARAIEERHGIK